MFNQRTQANTATNAVAVPALMAANLFFNVIANASFKVSATSPNWRSFVTWQVIGNLAGFVTVLTLTGLLRFIPLHIAYPVTVGLSVIGVQVGAVRWLFHEPVTQAQWLGTLLIAAGILLVAGRPS
jgi:multidrug transporter EmrE-like cation transporter